MTLPAGQTSAPHYHANEQWVYVLEGDLETVDGQKSNVGPGQILFFPLTWFIRLPCLKRRLSFFHL